METILTFAGIPVAVLLSFVLAVGIEVLLLGSALRLMQRAVAARRDASEQSSRAAS